MAERIIKAALLLLILAGLGRCGPEPGAWPSPSPMAEEVRPTKPGGFVGAPEVPPPSLSGEGPHIPGSPGSQGLPGGPITLALGGDVMLARLVSEALAKKGPAYPWGDVLPILQSADLALVNLECVIAASGQPFQPPRIFYFRAIPPAAQALSLAGIDYVSLANNHTLDYGPEALSEMLARLDQLGIAHAGAGGDLQEAVQPTLLEARGIKVGVVSFADHFVEYAATDSAPGTNMIPITTRPPHFSQVEGAIHAARAAGANLVVFSIHWGPNMRSRPPQEFQEFARAVMDAGADIFHGHSAHIFQGLEVYKGKLILYDTGDLVDDYYVDPWLRNDQQLLFLVTVSSTRVEKVELVPLLISNCQVNQARGHEFTAICERFRDLSREMGSQVEMEGSRLVVKLR